MTRRKTLFDVVAIDNKEYRRLESNDSTGYFHSFKKAKQTALNFVLKNEPGSQSYIFKIIAVIDDNGTPIFKTTPGFLTLIEKGEEGFINVFGNF